MGAVRKARMARKARMVSALTAAVLAGSLALGVGGCGNREEATGAAKEADEAAGNVAGGTAAESVEKPMTETGSAETPIAGTAAGAAGELPAGLAGGSAADAAPARLPSRYDSRELGRTSPVKNQGDLGTCWAFASLLALESSLLPEESLDLSEDHMSHDPHFQLGQEGGGDYIMSIAQPLPRRGPQTGAQQRAGGGEAPGGPGALKHVKAIYLLPEQDRQAIKRAVLESGGVQSALYTALEGGTGDSRYYDQETGAYYYEGDAAPNHDVVIVGWDDDFPKERFALEPPGDGAFLCENSWGTEFGLDGFFYVSYYDGNLGKVNLQYARAEDPEPYDRIYQTDACGWLGQAGYGSETAWAVNVYTAGGTEEILEEVGFYTTLPDSGYEVYLLRDVPEDPELGEGGSFSKRSLAASGRRRFAGYDTVSLDEPVRLSPGERFGVMVKLTTPGAVHPIAIEYDPGDGRCRIDLSDGEGYLSPDGVRWERAEETQGSNVCLKAYTWAGPEMQYERN